MDKPVIAVLNNNPRVMIDEEFDAYNEKFKFRRPENNETVTTKKALELNNDSEGCITCWRSPQLTSELLDAAPKLKIIAHAAGTLRPYVSDAVWGRGIKLVNAAGCIAEEVAQYVAALVVVGNQNGKIGIAHAKAKQVPDAIKKATENAKNKLLKIPLRDGRTLHHDVLGKDGAGKVLLRTAPSGTGIIAGGPIRAACEVIGIKDIVAKSIGSSNPMNVLRACIKGLKSQNSPKLIARLRGKKISEITKKKN